MKLRVDTGSGPLGAGNLKALCQEIVNFKVYEGYKEYPVYNEEGEVYCKIRYNRNEDAWERFVSASSYTKKKKGTCQRVWVPPTNVQVTIPECVVNGYTILAHDLTVAVPTHEATATIMIEKDILIQEHWEGIQGTFNMRPLAKGLTKTKAKNRKASTPLPEPKLMECQRCHTWQRVSRSRMICPKCGGYRFEVDISKLGKEEKE